MVPAKAWATPAVGRVDTASLSSICTKSPDSGRVDHSAFAVTWTSTTWPSPTVFRVTSGVPSASCAITRAASVGSGCAMTWALTVTSSGMASPKNGEVSAKGANALGSPQLIAPPTLRPPIRKRTGNNGSWSLRPKLDAASLGPAKRKRSPPFSTQAIMASSSDFAKAATSANTMTSGFAKRMSANVPSIKSAVGAKASRK